jgi:hypothetical protein
MVVYRDRAAQKIAGKSSKTQAGMSDFILHWKSNHILI